MVTISMFTFKSKHADVILLLWRHISTTSWLEIEI